MCITWPHICFTIHLLWCISYTIIGTIQVIVGVFFFASLPVLKLGSNIWVGIWNIIFGIGGAVFAMIGKWSLSKQRTFLYVAISVLIANVINLVLLEIFEWHILLPLNVKKLIEQGNLKMLVLYARTITTLSTIVAAAISFLDSQITFCSMQYHERYHNKKMTEKQDVLSDTEYVLPRVKSESDENENASYFNKQYPQSWVYETQTAETSTINSVPNRYSGTSSDNLIDSKQTSSEAEFKDISTQNLTIEQPIVVVENTSDYTDRQLHYMASFSRTPSPIPGSDSSSEHSGSIHAAPLQECLQKLTEPTVNRSRLNSAKSTSGVVGERPSPCVSPRPPSISGIDLAQHDTLIAELQDTISQKSFKISADQIFIPLKDEHVVRINDEIFITPKLSPKMERPPSEEISPPKETDSIVASPKEEEVKEPISAKIGAARPSLPEVVQVLRKDKIFPVESPNERPYSFHSIMAQQERLKSPNKRPHSLQSPVKQEEKITSPKEKLNSVQSSMQPDERVATPKERPHSLQSPVEQDVRLTSRKERPESFAPATTPEVREPYTFSPTLQREGKLQERVISTKESSCSKEEQSLTKNKSLEEKSQANWGLEAEQSLEQAMEQYLRLSPAQELQPSLLGMIVSPKEEQTIRSPSLERQPQIERDDTAVSESESYMLMSPQFDRQDTVISQKIPTPVLERQTPIERQDAITSPKEFQDYVPTLPDQADTFPSPIETDAGTTPETDEDFRVSDEIVSSNSNNVSTDKETIIDFKGSDDDEIDVLAQQVATENGVCNTPDLIEGIRRPEENATASESLGNEIDNIFKIAEDPTRLDDRDREDAELFNVKSDSSSTSISAADIPPPEVDPAFANIPPPEEMDDPDEWDETDDDDDSIDSSCIQRVPPPSTPND